MKKSCWNTLIAKEDEISDEVMEQVLCATAMGQATMYQGDGDHIIACIPTETVKQFRRRTKSSVFLLKTKKSKMSTVLMGCAILSRRGCKKGTIYLHDLYVRPKYRRKGVATGIVLTGGLEARKLGLKLRLGVNPKNDWAMALYAKLGMKPCTGQKIDMEWPEPVK